MPSAVDVLEERVAAAVELIVSLRSRVISLEREVNVARNNAPSCPQPPAAQPVPASQPDAALLEELQRLRAERIVVRESIRGLLREIDRISW